MEAELIDINCSLPAGLQTTPISDQNLTAMDTQVLVLRILEHDELAFETVYANFHKYVFLMAHRWLRSEFEAEEVLQDVFMALWRRPPALPHGLPSLIAWFNATTRNQCWMRLRRSDHNLVARDAPRPPQHLESVLERIANTELCCMLEREFLRVPHKHREVLQLTYFEDLGATEIANRLRMPVITVRKRLEVAILHLRRHLNSTDTRRRAL